MVFRKILETSFSMMRSIFCLSRSISNIFMFRLVLVNSDSSSYKGMYFFLSFLRRLVVNCFFLNSKTST